MPKFRKRPVVIEAVQYLGPGESVHRLLAFSAPIEPTGHWLGACGEPGHAENADLFIATLEDGDREVQHVASVGDWIIRGIQGEFYPCKPDIFAATYEPVE